MDELENLRQQLEELKALREKISVVENEKEEEIVEEADIEKNLEEELADLNSDLDKLQRELKRVVQEYDDSYQRFQRIVDEYEAKTEDTGLLSAEEIKELRETTEKLKLEENERSVEIQRRLNIQKKIIRDLKAKKTKLENSIKNANALGLTYEEYKDITSTIRKTSIMNSILEEKGLKSVIDKASNERTQEEKDLLKNTKKEILAEISAFRNEYDDYETLDIIEALYSLDTKYIEVKKPRELDIKEEEVNKLKEDTDILSYKVIDSSIKQNNNEVEETPEDMKDAKENEKVDINELKPAEEKVTVFKDSNNSDYYVRKYAADRFKLKSVDKNNEVKIQGSVCYKISEADVEKIKEHANNDFSPYIADIKEVATEDIKTPTKEVVEEQNEDGIIKKPRDRMPGEEPEEYEEFLRDYYSKVFPVEKDNFIYNNENIEKIPLPEINEIGEDEISVVDNNESDEIEEYSVVSYEDIPDSVIEPKELDTKSIEDIINEALAKQEPTTEASKLSDEDINKVLEESFNTVGRDGEIKEQEPTTEASKLSEEDINRVLEESFNIEERKDRQPIEEEPEEYSPSNIQASEEFKEELKKDNVLYRIVHSVPKFAKRIVSIFKNSNGETPENYDNMDEDERQKMYDAMLGNYPEEQQEERGMYR